MSKASAYFTLEKPQGKKGKTEIKRLLDTIPGVLSVSVNEQGRVAVDYDTTGTGTERIRKVLSNYGCEISSAYSEEHKM